jgi:type VII secretion integral membrane protein EccD
VSETTTATPSPALTTATRALLRVTVQSEGRRLDVGVPAQLPLIELMPGFARSLGVLDHTMTHTGYALQRADGTRLDPGRSAAEQNIVDGELLTLARGVLLAEPRVYDDIVEAVLDATADQHRPWTPKDNARTALAASLSLLGLCAVLLLAGTRGLGAGALIAAGGSVLLLVTATVIARLGQHEAGQGLGLAAAAFGALTGYLFVPAGHTLWGWPLATAGLGALLIGGLALALGREGREVHLVPVALGAAIGATGALAGLLPEHRVAVLTLMLAVVITLGNSLPWLALSSTRIRVISPQNDLEVFDTPQPIDSDDVRRRAAAGHRTLIALRIAHGLAALAVTPLVAAQNPTGALLCGLGFLGMMFPARQSFARAEVIAVMGLGTAGIAATGITASLALAGIRLPLLVVLISAAVIVVTITLLDPRARLRLARLADGVEVSILAVLLPLGVIAAGLT